MKLFSKILPLFLAINLAFRAFVNICKIFIASVSLSIVFFTFSRRGIFYWGDIAKIVPNSLRTIKIHMCVCIFTETTFTFGE